MGSLNKVQLIGNLAADPEVRFTKDGKPVANFRMATNAKYGDKEYVEWHRITVWGKLAETCGEYLTKGRQVYIEGRLQTRSYEDKEKNKRFVTEIVAHQVTFLGAKPQGDQQEELDLGPSAEEPNF